MKKLALLLVLISTACIAQVGINTTTPKASLDITASNVTTPANTDGILIPRIDDYPLTDPTANQDGMMVFVTGNGIPTEGFYYWDQGTTSWVLVGGGSGASKIDELTDGKSDNDGSQNGSSVFLGVDAGTLDDSSDNKNVGIGFESLTSCTTGFWNTAVGYSSLSKTTSGHSNTAIGYLTLTNNLTGINNTALGREALRSSFGSSNTALGHSTLTANTSGARNTAVGAFALLRNTLGIENTAVGYNTLQYNTLGYYNTTLGINSLSSNTIGNMNTSIGNSTMINIIAGERNTAIGFASYNSGGNDYSNSTALGAYTLIDGSNQVHLGSTSVTEVKGQVNYSTYSDGRIKENITEEVIGLSFIKKLRPVTYNINLDRQNNLLGIIDTSHFKEKYDIEKIRFSGFIAQEVEKAANNTGYDFSGIKTPKNNKQLYGLSYAEFVVPIVKAIQEQQFIIEEQKNKIENLEARLLKIESFFEITQNTN